MRRRPESSRTVSARHGEWGEDVAVERLRLEGYEILERNCRPCAWNRRYEIDVVAYDRVSDALVFVEVKQHRTHSAWERRLRSVDRDKKRCLRVACNAWRRQNRWRGSYRFDVVEVFGEPGMGSPEIDHIERVNLFVDSERFVSWR